MRPIDLGKTILAVILAVVSEATAQRDPNKGGCRCLTLSPVIPALMLDLDGSQRNSTFDAVLNSGAVHNGYNGGYDHGYAACNGFVCQPGTWFRGEDGRRHLCQ